MTEEQIKTLQEKGKQAASVDELKKIAYDNGIELADDLATKCFMLIHNGDELHQQILDRLVPKDE